MNLKRLAIQALRRRPNWVSAEAGTFSLEGKAVLEWVPFLIGSLSGSIGRYMVNDDSNGNIFTQWPQLVTRIGTVNYLTGEMTLLFQPSAPALTYILGYCYLPDETMPEIYEMKIVSSPVVARPRRINFPIH